MRALIVGGVLLGAMAVLSPLQAAELDTSKCVFPEQVPTAPDGNTASQDQMIEASSAVKAFVVENEKGLACLDQVKAGFIAEPVTPEQQAQFTSTYNAAVDAATKVGESWNLSVRAFKAKNPD